MTQEIHNKRKKEMLYQKWLKNVFNPMHSKLSEVMKDSMYKEYDNIRKELYLKNTVQEQKGEYTIRGKILVWEIFGEPYR